MSQRTTSPPTSHNVVLFSHPQEVSCCFCAPDTLIPGVPCTMLSLSWQSIFLIFPSGGFPLRPIVATI